MSNKNRNQHQLYSSINTVVSETEATHIFPVEDLQQQQNQTTDIEQTDAEVDTKQTSAVKDKALAMPVIETKPTEAAKADTKQPKAFVDQTQKGFKPVYKIELELTNYAEAMDKKNTIVPEEGGKWQYTLFKTIKSCFAATSQDVFNAEFNTIINFFQKNKDGIFNEKFIFRFPENWPGSQNEYTQNRRLLYLIIQTTDPKTRKKVLEQINMEIVAEGMTESQKQMLFNYYQM